MTPLRPGIRRLLRLGGSGAGETEQQVDEEIQLHLDLLAERLVQEGLDPAAAAREAQRRFHGVSPKREALYAAAHTREEQVRFRQRWESIAQDLRYAARSLAREPMMTSFVVLTIALGLGASLLGFGFVDRVLLRGPEFVVEPDRVVRIFQRTEGPPFGTQTTTWLPYQTYRHIAQELSAFSSTGAYRPFPATIGQGEQARTVRLVLVLGGYFTVSGARPLQGRFFTAGDDAATSGPLAVISAGLWRNEFGATPDIVGRSIVIDNVRHSIVGVAPDRFAGPDQGRVDIWRLGNTTTATTQNWWIVGRMRPGATIASVSAEVDALHRRTAADGPAWTRDARIFAGSLRLGAGARLSIEGVMAGWLSGISLIVLVIAAANVVNLLLARLARRQRELGVRIALGAGQARVARLLMIEGALLASLSAVVSLGLLLIAEPVFRRTLFPDAAWTLQVLDLRLLAVLLVIVMCTGLVFGMIPAMKAGGTSLTAALRGGRANAMIQTRLRAALTVAQTTLSVLLLIGAGLFVRSQYRVNAVDLGMDVRNILAPDIRVRPTEGSGNRALIEREQDRRLLDAVSQVPGVAQVTLVIAGPMTGSGYSTALMVPGFDTIPVYPGGGPYLTAVGADYFSTVGTRIIAGRPLLGTDHEGTEPVAVVSQSMAAALWPGRSALDACIHVGGVTAPCSRIVGIAADVHRTAIQEEAALQYYVPIGQEVGVSGTQMLIRTKGDGTALFPAIRRALLNADPAVQTVDSRILSEVLDHETRPLRLGLLAFGLSGGLAIVVALLGLYSLMSYMVAWRTHEIGVRMALGADRSGVVTLVVRDAVLLALTGVGLGGILALVTGPYLEPFLFRTRGNDPMVYAVVALLLLGVALLAGAVPASRAVRISPTEALRAD